MDSHEAFFGKGLWETEQVYPSVPWNHTQLLSRSGKRGFSITPRGGESRRTSRRLFYFVRGTSDACSPVVSHSVGYSRVSDPFGSFDKSDSPRGTKHLVGLLVLGYERGMELTADYLEAFLTLSRVGTDRLYGLKSRTHMEVLKGFPQDGCGWKSYFFYVRLDQASVAVECLPSFRRLWETGGNVLNDHSLPFLLPVFFYILPYLYYVHFAVHNPIPPFPEDLCIVRDLLRGGPLFWGHFSLERVRAAVEAHRFRFSSSIDNVMEASFEDTSLSTVYAAGRSSGRGSLDAEEDGEPTVDDPIWMD